MAKQQTQQVKINKDYAPKNDNEFKQCLRSRLWRLNNLYTIKDKNAELVHFKLNDEQLDLMHRMHSRNVILKVRQLGISTFWLIYQLDAALFYGGVECGTVAHSREDAQELFENKVKLAFDYLPKQIKNMHTQRSDSARKLAFSNGSSVRIGTSFRSGTPVIVLISEFGKISAKYPEHAREIETGTFNAVPQNGILVVESTAEGTDNRFYQLVAEARRKQLQGEKLSPFDFKLFFYDWIRTSQYKMNASYKVSDEINSYCDGLEHEMDLKIPSNKRKWYQLKSGGIVTPEMRQEYPSTVDEAFRTVIEGAYFSKEMNQLRREGRITTLKPDPDTLVDTAWDLGYSDDTAIIFFQVYRNGEVNVIDYYQNSGEALQHYIHVLEDKRKEKGYLYGNHYVPHDSGHTSQQTGMTVVEYAATLGLKMVALPKANAKQDKVESARRVLHRCNIDTERCGKLVECLDNYRRQWRTATGTFSDKPLHDKFSHGADAFQEMAYAVNNYGGSVGAMTSERADELYSTYGPPVL